MVYSGPGWFMFHILETPGETEISFLQNGKAVLSVLFYFFRKPRIQEKLLQQGFFCCEGLSPLTPMLDFNILCCLPPLEELKCKNMVKMVHCYSSCILGSN